MEKSSKHKSILLAVITVSILATLLLTACGAKTASPVQELTLEGVHLDIVSVTLGQSFPAGCTGGIPACTPARSGTDILSVTFQPRDLPKGQMLAYKNLPAVSVTPKDENAVPYSLYKYDNVAHTLTLGFEVPEGAAISGLKWADLEEIPLEVTQ